MMKKLALTLLFMLTASPGWAATKYATPTGTASWANASAIETPCSLATANANVAAGDIVYMLAGTYNGQIKPVANGTSGNRITYEGVAGGNKPVIARTTTGEGNEPISLISKQYVTVRNVAISGSGSNWADVKSSLHVYLENIDFSGLANTWRGVNAEAATYLKIINSTFADAPACPPPADGTCPADFVWLRGSGGHHNLVEGNTFGKIGHTALNAGDNTAWLVLRNNTFSNLWHHNASFELTNYTGARNLFEGNLVRNAGADCATNPDASEACVDSRFQTYNNKSLALTAANRNIVRRNVFFNNGSLEMGSYTGNVSKGNRVYHNVFDQEERALFYAASAAYAEWSGNVFKNNSITRSTGDSGATGYGLRATVPTENAARDVNSFIHNNWYQNQSNSYKQITATDAQIGNDFNGQWASEFDGNLNVDPKYTNWHLRDYSLQADSALVDAGAWLTTVTAHTAGSTAVTVADASYFMDGWGIVSADQIQFEGDATVYTISSINYDTNVITLTAGPAGSMATKGVSLPYSGDAPDIGVYELEQDDPEPPAGTGLPTGATHAWKLNNEDLTDIIGDADFTSSGTVTARADHLGTANSALYLPAGANYLEIADASAPVSHGTDWSVCVHAKKEAQVTGPGGDYFTILGKRASGQLEWWVQTGKETNYNMELRRSTSGSATTTPSATWTTATEMWPAGTWKHICVTYDVDTLTAKLWYEGVERASSTQSADIFNGTGPFRLGQQSGSSLRSDFTYADLVRYDRVLTESEISTIKNLDSDFGGDDPTPPQVQLTYFGDNKMAVNKGDTVSIAYGTQGALTKVEWRKCLNDNDCSEGGSWTTIADAPATGTIETTESSAGLVTYQVKLNNNESLITTKADWVRVWCSPLERAICTTGDCCDDDGENLSFDAATGFANSTLRLIGNVNLDLSGAGETDLFLLTGTGYGTITGGRIINSNWTPSSPPTMGNNVTLVGRIWPIMNWSGTGGSIQENTLFLGSGTGYTLDLSGLDGVSEACYVLPERPHGTLTFTSLDPGPCLEACTNARECVDPTWQRSLMHLISK